MKQRFAIVHFYGFSLHPNTFYIGFILWVFCSDVIGNFNGTISNMKNSIIQATIYAWLGAFIKKWMIFMLSRSTTVFS